MGLFAALYDDISIEYQKFLFFGAFSSLSNSLSPALSPEKGSNPLVHTMALPTAQFWIMFKNGWNLRGKEGVCVCVCRRGWGLKSTTATDRCFGVEGFSHPPSPEAGSKVEDNPEPDQLESLPPAPVMPEAKAVEAAAVAKQEFGPISKV